MIAIIRNTQAIVDDDKYIVRYVFSRNNSEHYIDVDIDNIKQKESVQLCKVHSTLTIDVNKYIDSLKHNHNGNKHCDNTLKKLLYMIDQYAEMIMPIEDYDNNNNLLADIYLSCPLCEQSTFFDEFDSYINEDDEDDDNDNDGDIYNYY